MYESYEFIPEGKVRCEGHHGESRLIEISEVQSYFGNLLTRDWKTSLNYTWCGSFRQTSKFIFSHVEKSNGSRICLIDNFIYHKFKSGSVKLAEFSSVKESVEIWNNLVGGPIYWNPEADITKPFVKEILEYNESSPRGFDLIQLPVVKLNKLELLKTGLSVGSKVTLNKFTINDGKREYTFTDKIEKSYEKQRIQLEPTKYYEHYYLVNGKLSRDHPNKIIQASDVFVIERLNGYIRLIDEKPKTVGLMGYKSDFDRLESHLSPEISQTELESLCDKFRIKIFIPSDAVHTQLIEDIIITDASKSIFRNFDFNQVQDISNH